MQVLLFRKRIPLGRFVYTCKTKCPINIEWDIPLVVSRAHHTFECTIQFSQNEFWHIEQTWSRNAFEMNVNQPNGDKCVSPTPFECMSRRREKMPATLCGSRVCMTGHLSLFKSNYRQNAYWHISWWISWEMSLFCTTLDGWNIVHSESKPWEGAYAYIYERKRRIYIFLLVQKCYVRQIENGILRNSFHLPIPTPLIKLNSIHNAKASDPP